MNSKKILIGLLLLIVSQFSLSQNYVAVYQLKNYYTTSLTMRVELSTQNLRPFVLERSRWWLGDKRPIKKVFCADDNREVPYNRPQTCSLLYWNIEFQRQYNITGLGGLADGDYYLNNGQWLLRESKNFPRLKGDPKAVVCINPNNCWPLPSKDKLSGFLFMIWGKNPYTTDIAGVKYEIFSDKQSEGIDKKQLMEQLEPGFRYLNNVFFSKLGNYIKKPVKIVMLAKNVHVLKDAGGQAGDHAFIVNYYVKDGQLINNWQGSFSRVAMHEYVHLLAPCGLFPRWACESLADYYTYKASSLGEVNTKALIYWSKVQNSDINYQKGLYQLDKLYQQTKNRVYYNLFYAKGAAFWNDLDIFLHQKGANLDDYLSLLVINPNIYQSTLPQVFTDRMREIIGNDAYNQLANKYLN